MARGALVLAAVMVTASWGGAVAARTTTSGVSAQGTTTNDAVYTAEQAAKGQALYGQSCESCHQPAKFVGAEFTRAYGGRPLLEIDRSMKDMPMDNPGTLTRDDVAALIAYFLQLNKYPAGQAPLSGEPETLKGVVVAPRP